MSKITRREFNRQLVLGTAGMATLGAGLGSIRSASNQYTVVRTDGSEGTNAHADRAAEVLAFPGAEGAGRFTTGGRGGTVFVVTSLAANGPGTLADAVSQPNRFVVFAVSGVIDLEKDGKGKGGRLAVEQPNITIAGQTAPGEGICLRGGSLVVRSSNVILRYLRSRRGFVKFGDTGDAITVKPITRGEAQVAVARSQQKLDKINAKKIQRGGGVLRVPGLASDIMLDHLSASWATDENLSMTHADRSTMQWCIAAEGLDYHNPNQTPPNHSEGSLWGSSAPSGHATAHHMFYADNRLRNPRTTGGAMPPAELTLYNSVIYNWSEEATHTGSEAIYLNLVNNYYKPGPDTPARLRRIFFEFHCDPRGRVFIAGNLLEGAPDCSADNSKAVIWDERDLSGGQRRSMLSPVLLGKPPVCLQTAQEAFVSVLHDAGATLPARDAVDWRIVEGVRTGQGRIIAKETDLPPSERWPDYRSLPPPPDRDHDGLPDFWEEQFGLNPDDPTDSMKISANGYANIEHYCNNTDPRGGHTPIIFVSATVSRAHTGKMQPGSIRFSRSTASAESLQIRYTITGDARNDTDFVRLSGEVIIPPGASFAEVPIVPLKAGRGMVVLTPQPNPAYHIGCPSAALVVINQ